MLKEAQEPSVDCCEVLVNIFPIVCSALNFSRSDLKYGIFLSYFIGVN
uniref:Uncharacterized protein n=1 Tax=Lepeophtheirus salmonis TaxID=72036 RepID=A0A0K2TW33_LEPSM